MPDVPPPCLWLQVMIIYFFFHFRDVYTKREGPFSSSPYLLPASSPFNNHTYHLCTVLLQTASAFRTGKIMKIYNECSFSESTYLHPLLLEFDKFAPKHPELHFH
ncbi:hypothetical protein GOODEAATRI_018886 [Goodea atripinnis]|uniref:Secreted protein n=1 Tax=Goodea atripinnis TaxID=208336 RepID=A0ABV0PF67_9TELE